MAIILAFLFFVPITFGADIPKYTITHIAIKPDPKLFKSKDPTIIYPIFHFPENPRLEKKVNRVLRQELLEKWIDVIDERKSLKQELLAARNQGLIDLELDSVTFINGNLIAFNLSAGWTAAYFTSWRECFVFDLYDGDRLRVTDLIKPERLVDFHRLVSEKFKAVIQAFRNSARERVLRKEIEPEDYDYIVEETEHNCEDLFDPLDYILHQDSIEIIVHCGFAHIAQALADYDNIFLSRKEVQSMLRDDLY